MTVETLLSRLEKVKQTGRGRWIARCPTRQDRTPSLAIRELDDGRILLHDFGGDSVESILAAVGLSMPDLFPDKLNPDAKREHMPFSYADALRCVAFESTLAAVAASNVANGHPLSDRDRARLLTASRRINHALEVCKCR